MRNLIFILAASAAASAAMAGLVSESYSFVGSIPIPDNVTGFTSIPITVPASGVPGGSVVGGMSVDFMMRHTWQGDIKVRLRAPNGLEIGLMDRPGVPQQTFGFSADNFGNLATGVPFTWADSAPASYDTGSPGVAATGNNDPIGSWRPDGADRFSAFAGMNRVGTWTLLVSDNATGDTGAVLGWTVRFLVPTPGTALLPLVPAIFAGIRRRRR